MPVVITLLGLLTLYKIDSMDMASIFPLLVLQGIILTVFMVRTRDLGVPLWFGRQIMRWVPMSILLLTFVGLS